MKIAGSVQELELFFKKFNLTKKAEIRIDGTKISEQITKTLKETGGKDNESWKKDCRAWKLHPGIKEKTKRRKNRCNIQSVQFNNIYIHNNYSYSINYQILRKGDEIEMFTRKDRKIRSQKAMIENRDILIKDMEEQAEVQNAELRDLRYENSELFDFRTRVIDIIKGKGTIVSKYDKIEELVNRLLIEN